MSECKTVADVITELSRLDPQMPVAGALHSDYRSGVTVRTRELADMGGYLSWPYPPVAKETRTYVIIE